MSADLTTRYLGLSLAHPVIASASPLTSTFDGMRRLEDAGAAAVVMVSLHEEQIRGEDTAYTLLTEHGSYSQAEAGTYFPELPDYNEGVAGHLESLRRASEALDIPVIASLNGTSSEGWTEYAHVLEQAGAAALELNVFHVPAEQQSSGEVEATYLEILRRVKASVHIPVSVKLSPFFSSLGHMAKELERAGADGLVLFNRVVQRDIDLETLELKVDFQLSTPSEIHLPLAWTALLSPHVGLSLAASGGVETFEQVVKYLLVGADAVMTTSALLRHSPERLGTLVVALEGWLEANRFPSVAAIRGLKAVKSAEDAAQRLRSDYVKSLTGYLPKRLIA